MNITLIGTLVAAGVTSLAMAVGCGGDDGGDTSSATSSTGATGMTTSASSASASSGGMSTSSAATGGGTCAMGLDTECEKCGAAKCMTEALACADESTCDAMGEPTAGCLALVNCAALKCNADLPCILDKCAKELESAGGIAGAGTAAAQALGTCVQGKCSNECLAGAGGGM